MVSCFLKAHLHSNFSILRGLQVNTSSAAAAQPIGFAAGVKAAEERISAVRSAHNIPPEQAVLSVENFLVEIGENK